MAGDRAAVIEGRVSNLRPVPATIPKHGPGCVYGGVGACRADFITVGV
jgi:hypothetical protein